MQDTIYCRGIFKTGIEISDFPELPQNGQIQNYINSSNKENV